MQCFILSKQGYHDTMLAPCLKAHFVCLLSGAGQDEWRSRLLRRAVRMNQNSKVEVCKTKTMSWETLKSSIKLSHVRHFCGFIPVSHLLDYIYKTVTFQQFFRLQYSFWPPKHNMDLLQHFFRGLFQSRQKYVNKDQQNILEKVWPFCFQQIYL